MSELDGFKAAAAHAALEHVEPGSVVGLGSGSTAAFLIEELGRRILHGELRGITAVPSSLRTDRAARDAGIPLVELGAGGVDVAIDGMDEVTDDLDATKGLGGSLAREKVVAASARLFILVADHTKRVAALGERAPVPVEVLGFGHRYTAARLAELGCQPTLRRVGGELFVTDNGNPILDCTVPAGFDPRGFAAAVERMPGVVAHGLFLGIASYAYLAGADGVVTLRRASEPGASAATR
jgi:ribose 5-phosphate isomerase A